jgi:hypothetical protein
VIDALGELYGLPEHEAEADLGAAIASGRIAANTDTGWLRWPPAERAARSAALAAEEAERMARARAALEAARL